VVAPIWAVPMDIAPEHAGKASGVMNLGFGIAGTVSPAVVGAIIDVTDSRTLPFAASVLLLLAGAVLALRIRPDRRLEARLTVN
jgi:MFS family permease